MSRERRSRPEPGLPKEMDGPGGSDPADPGRREFLAALVAAASMLAPEALGGAVREGRRRAVGEAGPTASPEAMPKAIQEAGGVSEEAIRWAQELAGVTFGEEERAMMVEGLGELLAGYRRLRAVDTPDSLPPAFVYDPERVLAASGSRTPPAAGDADASVLLPAGTGSSVPVSDPELAAGELTDADLAYASIPTLARLLRDGAVSSVELTELALHRLRLHGPRLECVVTLTEERALRQAEQADDELGRGMDRGLLHGIPWGAKDLFDVSGHPTTWGAEPYRDRSVDGTATVVRRLDDAGAVLVAKLTLGALAMGDVWYGGQTRNPWDPEQGSSGSSAGSAAATAAGLVPFALGTETLGSIVSPAFRCGVTGLRPTFGRVSRAGAMPLSWTMDKVGPLARSARDCGIVLATVHGRDPLDPSSRTMPFRRGATEAEPDDREAGTGGLRIGFDRAAFQGDQVAPADRRTLESFRRAGLEPEPVDLPRSIPADDLFLVLLAEAGAAFDELTRSEEVDELVRQDPEAWPTLFRTSRFIPAVEYVRGNRIRSRLLAELDEALTGFDAVIAPSFADGVLSMTNLTGHPALQLPNGFSEGRPTGISLIGPLWGEAGLVAAAGVYQRVTDFHGRRPPGFG